MAKTDVKPVQTDDDPLIFELSYPDGQWVRIYLHGRVEGVPEGTILINRAQPLLGFLQARADAEAMTKFADRVFQLLTSPVPFVPL